MPARFSLPARLSKNLVVITRPQSQAESLAARLRDSGCDVSIFPLLDIQPIPDPSQLKACLNKLTDYAMVIDVRDCPIQQQGVIKAMGEHMARMPKARAIAIVTGRSLAKMQVRRLFTQPYARIVDDVE